VGGSEPPAGGPTPPPSTQRAVGDIDEESAGCLYDFGITHDLVLVGFSGLIANELAGFGEPAGPGVSPRPAVPFEFFNTVSTIPVGRVFVRDFEQIFYHRGVRGLGATIPEVADGLRRLLEPAGRVVFTGQSAGGYAAILFGTLLGVDDVVAFSPQTFMTRGLRRLYHDDRWPAEMAAINRIYPLRGRESLNLRRVLDRRNRCSRIHIHFGARNRLDAVHATHLEGLPGVSLRPFDTRSHAVARRMREVGMLRPALLDVLDRPTRGR